MSMNHQPQSPAQGTKSASPTASLRQLADDIRVEVQARFGSFVRERINPGAVERYQNHTPFRRELFESREIRELLRFPLSKARGGDGRDMTSWCLVIEQLGYLSEDATWVDAVYHQVNIFQTLSHGSAAIQRDYANPISRGEMYATTALWENLDYQALESTAKRVDGGWSLDGWKGYINFGGICDAFVVYARDGDTGDLMAFVVNRNDSGVATKPFRSHGAPATCPVELKLSAVFVPDDHVLVSADAHGLAAGHFRDERVQSASLIVGVTQRLIDALIRKLQDKVRGDRPLIYQPNVLIEIGRMTARLEAARSLIYRAIAEDIDGGRDDADPTFSTLGSSAKIIATEQAIAACAHMMNFCGADAYKEAEPWGRFQRDATAFTVGQGASDMLLMQIAERSILNVDLMAHLAAGKR